MVVSDTGGLAEIVEHGVDGYKALPGHVDSLAWHVMELLKQPKLRTAMAERAFRKLQERYAWPVIAASIRDVYRSLDFAANAEVAEGGRMLPAAGLGASEASDDALAAAAAVLADPATAAAFAAAEAEAAAQGLEGGGI